MQLVCRNTQTEYPIDAKRWQSDAGSTLDLDFEGIIKPELVEWRDSTLWRYHEALPLADEGCLITFDEGMTPLVPVKIGGAEIQVKLDFMFPTGSYKDRGSTVMISLAKSLGVEKVVQDSSGNAGASVACYCAKAGIDCEIFVPEGTSAAKLQQIAAYGASIRVISGSREDTAQAAQEAANSTFYASHVWNPFFVHGTKTFAFEICEQLGWQAPHTVVVPVGNGTLVLGAYLGFRDLLRGGIIDWMPRIVGVQAANCAPLVEAYHRQFPGLTPVQTSSTLAEGIAIAAPARGEQILDTIRETEGQMLAVAEEEIVTTWREMAQQGFFIEPTSAVTIAGVKLYLQCRAQPNESIVTLFTGHGLKAADKINQLMKSY